MIFINLYQFCWCLQPPSASRLGHKHPGPFFFNEAGQESGRDCSCCNAMTHQVCPHCGICPCSWRERGRLARNIMYNCEAWTEKDKALGKSPAIILPAARASEEAEIQEDAVGTLGPERKKLQMHLASIISELLKQFCSMHYAHGFFSSLTVSVLPSHSCW